MHEQATPGPRVPAVRALRGAASVALNERESIVDATARLLDELLTRNGVAADELVSIVFTSTADLDAEFPAAAARRLGLNDVPLLCSTEIAVPGALPRCVRVLIHMYTDRPRDELQHIYLGDARGLRGDLSEQERPGGDSP